MFGISFFFLSAFMWIMPFGKIWMKVLSSSSPTCKDGFFRSKPELFTSLTIFFYYFYFYLICNLLIDVCLIEDKIECTMHDYLQINKIYG